MAGHQALLRLLDQPEALMNALQNQAKAARKAAQLIHAQSALLQLQLTAQQAAHRCSFGQIMMHMQVALVKLI